MGKLSRVEEYVVSKGWEYRDAGSNIAVEYCPFCTGDGFKFFINTENFLWDCKRGSCGRNGNEYKLKSHMGDRMQQSGDEEVVETKERGEIKREKVPDIEQAHEWLLESAPMMNFLNDTRDWGHDIVARMKVGMMNRFIRDEEKEVGCFTYPYFVNGKPVFVKFRTLPGEKKNFASLNGHDAPLYNQDVIKKDMDYLVLVEGEADCISVLNIGEENVVGVPGASTKKAMWADLLNFPGKLYLLYDNDEDGQVGAKKFAQRFGEDRFWNIVIPEFDLIEPIEDKHGTRTKGKDITEWLMAVDGDKLAKFKELLATGEQFSPEGILTFGQALIDIRTDVVSRGTNEPTYLTPWPSLNKTFGGCEDGQMIIVQAPQKSGKTTLALNLADHFTVVNNVNVILECLEMTQQDLVRKLASKITGTDDTPGNLSTQQLLFMIDKADEKYREREAQILFGFNAVTSLEGQMERMRSLIRRYAAKVWIFDNLQYLVDRLYTGQSMGNRASFMSKVTKGFKSLCMETKTLGILIAQTKSMEDDAVATTRSLEGSSAPGNDCDVMLIMNRTKLLPVKSKNDLAKLAQSGDNVLTTATYNPELYIECGLTRRARGGLCVLKLDGGRSLIHERDDIERIAAQQTGQKSEYVGNTLFEYAEDKIAKKVMVQTADDSVDIEQAVTL